MKPLLHIAMLSCQIMSIEYSMTNNTYDTKECKVCSVNHPMKYERNVRPGEKFAIIVES